jgi:LacI family transcriptional regulator
MRTDAPLYQQLVQERFPIVLCAENVGELSSIDIEWDSGMRQAVAYLRDKGHRHVGFVAYAQTDAEIPGNPKLQALQRACDDHGIRCSTHRLTQLSDIDEAERFGMEIAQQNDRPTAFVVYSDYVAFGFMRGLLNRGMRIPQDVAVVGIDGTQMGRVFHPSLTSIALERSQIVVAAVEMVLNMIDKKQQPGQKRVFPTKLMIRESA